VQWGLPMVAAPYGPLWLAVTRCVALATHDLTWAVLCFRGIGAAGFLLLVYLSRYVARSVLPIVIAANPFFIWYFVVDGHNDIWGLDAIVAALLFLRRRALLPAAFAIAVAGAVKLPLLAAAIPVTLALDRVSRRVAVVALSVLLSIAVVLPIRNLYFGALLSHAAQRQSIFIAHGVFALVGVIALALALLKGWTRGGLGWSIAGLGAGVFPWYFAWSVPYAVMDRKTATMVACLPVLAASIDSCFGSLTTILLGIACVTALTMLPLEPLRPRA
jgi:hypothetical protein